MKAAIQVEHLYSYTYRNQRSRQLTFHKHPFWQLEVIRDGPVTYIDNSGALTIAGGQSILIPSGCSHSFAYPKGKVSWMSCKFNVSGAVHPEQTLVIPDTPLPESIVKAITAFVDERPATGSNTVFNTLAAALLECLADDRSPGEPPMDPFLRRIEKELQRPWTSVISVRALATRLDYEPGYLSVKFKQVTGQTLKDYIDQRRVARAVELLEYSSLTVSEIAETLAFPEVYAFSRFFKRCKGLSPRAWRKKRQPEAHS